MSAEYTTFGLAPAARTGGVLAGGAYQVHRDFLDFIVDGRPLLFRLSDLDAVSPLAADVPPAIFTAQVRGLLLEAGPPLPDGRYIIYGCPECEDLACGAVTAVIRRDGDDYVWRDFAWQTTPDADLTRNGYHGIGPFRFPGAEYRAALAPLLDRGPGAPRRRVLLVGARAAALGRVAAALRTIDIGADLAPDLADASADELCQYGAVAFGPAVPEEARAAVRAAFTAAGATGVSYVDEPAPIVPVLVAQIEHALDRTPVERRRLTGLAVTDAAAGVEVTSPCRIRLTAYRLDRLRRTRVHELFDGVLEPGVHRLALAAGALKGRSYLVARAPESVLVTHGKPG
ncbi:oxidoreductase [Streptomyces sp. JW3]|uniref:oxidoreductase n=1 Tax=Streptomyces sp. JW3 TaxID=3456955 RepID=UPI003FA447BC